ncbi:MAG: Biotin synthase [Parcubacteria group bacterium ADurb.Bin326]|nr:MAG: Biotin synthase [Parcubacteria group bacterium ADurb.Bin326]
MVKVGSTDDLAVDDWVLFTSDFLIKKIDQQEANEIFELLGGYGARIPETVNEKLREVLLKNRGEGLEAKDLEFLLSLKNEDDLQALFAQANLTRKESIKDHVCIHGIIEFSNYCKNDCLYCGLRRSNQGVNRYRLSQEEIIKTAVKAVDDKGYKILVLQSGEDDYYTKERIVEIIRSIKGQVRIFIYLSVGDRTFDDYRAFKEAGANGVLYRFESSNSELYAKMRPEHQLSQRLDNLKMMRSLGYVISTGMIVGLPGQAVKDLAQDILLMKELGTFMPSFGPLVAASGTPLENSQAVDPKLILKVIAATRLAMPKARIPVTTAMETLVGGDLARKQCFSAGANAVMLNLTPSGHNKDYMIYDNKFFDTDKSYERWGLFKGEVSYEMLENELGFQI